jgi:Ser/Thr protein kinase RdoA (MazF antagonist)
MAARPMPGLVRGSPFTTASVRTKRFAEASFWLTEAPSFGNLMTMLRFCDQLPSALAQFLISLGRVGLVHGDIRPWNILCDLNNKEFRIIDWGFSFFLVTPSITI